MAAPEGFVELREGPNFGWVVRELADVGLGPFWGELQPLQGGKGRGGVGVLTIADRELVVRPLRRGGALGRLLVDRYASSRRVLNEIETLTGLRSEGVPCVVPIAAVARRHGVSWRMRLCTERVPGAVPLPQFLAEHPGRRRHVAESVGILLRLAFEAGLHHPDLHPDNIICALRGDRVRVMLVDLDRAKLQKPVEPRDVDGMLVRMARYLVKHRASLPAMPTLPERMRLLRALGFDREGRKEAFLRLEARLRRQIGRRRWIGR